MSISISASQQPVFVVDAVRTPIGKYAGALSSIRADDLAAHVIEALVSRQKELAPSLDQVVFGATNQAGEDNRNVARMALLLAGLPYTVPAVTVNRLCGSGLEAIADAARMIAVGEADCAIAGGVENMSRAPYVFSKSDRPFSRTPPTLYDTALGWRFPNPRMAARFELTSMGMTAENVARKHAISRQDQDAYALLSHQKAAAAVDAGHFDDEIVPITLPGQRKGHGQKGDPIVVSRDESIRRDSSADKLATLKPVFCEGGSVTAGNSSPINDGAAAVMLCSGRLIEQYKLTPLGRIVASSTVGVDPAYMGEGPINAVRAVLRRTNLRAPLVDLVELNEAFSAQTLACIRTLDVDPERVNISGGAIALGHPIGCSGARIMVTLLYGMRRRNASIGLASLCIGVGQGIATLVERG